MLNQLRLSIARVPSSRLVLAPLSFTGIRNCHSDPVQSSSTERQTFAALVRDCKFTRIGNPIGKVVVGKIYHVVGDDLYIDFGHKFCCVCTKPR